MRLRDQNISLLEQGVDLLSDIDRALYGPEGGTSGVGAHMRHVIDCYQCFLRGVARETGAPVPTLRVDYDARERRAAIESDPDVAIRTMREVADAIVALEADDRQQIEVQVDQPPGIDEPTPWQRSSVGRELQFLISHTTHHYALIALLLSRHGVTLDPGFGVAQSTLAHRCRESAGAGSS